MAERFIKKEALVELGTQIFITAGVGEEESRRVSENLVEANLYGHDSHGIGLVPKYIEDLKGKQLFPDRKIKILKEYESMELCKTVKRVMGEWHYDDEDIKRLSMIMTLYQTDFSKEDIDEYMQLILSGENDEECLKILSQKRKKALDKIHILEKQISNLDYLKNEIKNNN